MSVAAMVLIAVSVFFMLSKSARNNHSKQSVQATWQWLGVGLSDIMQLDHNRGNANN